uniref:Nephrin n=1 Tax=Plectus sambesii TaxID=2011161 RepID=A0A914WZB5_9BILA
MSPQSGTLFQSTRSPMANLLPIASLYLLLLLLLSASSVGALQHSERPTNVTVRTGDRLTLRCAIQNPTGQAVQVQWRAPNDDMLGFVRGVVPGFPRYSIVGDQTAGEYHLSIENVTLEDDGEFECQVLPSNGAQNQLRAGALVSVVVAPTKVTLGPAYRDGGNFEVNAGIDIQIACRGEYAKPAAQLVWYKNGEQITEGIHVAQNTAENRTVTTVSTLKWSARAGDHQAIFACDAVHPGLSGRQMRTNFTLNVLYPPGAPHIRGIDSDQVLSAGEPVNLVCSVENGNPAPTVQWYRNDKKIDSTFESDVGSKETRNEYSFIADANENGALYECRASNQPDQQPQVARVQLQVNHAPKAVEIRGPSMARQGETVRLECHSKPSHPPAMIAWMIDGRPMEGNAVIVKKTVDGTGSITVSNVSFVVAADERREIGVVCQAWNPVIDSPRVSLPVAIQVLYAPDPPVIYGFDGNSVVEGQQQQLTCVARGGNPLATLQWYIGNHKVTNGTQDTVSGDTAQSVFAFTADRTHNGGQFRCEARNHALDRALKANVTMRVLFAPKSVEVTALNKLRAGHPAQLFCDVSAANPSPVVIWTRNGEPLPGQLLHNKTGPDFGWEVRDALRFVPTAADDGANFKCTARHDAWDKEVSDLIAINVQYAPSFRKPGPLTVSVLVNESFVENMTVRAKPDAVAFEWFKDNVRFRSNGASITTDGGVLYANKVRRADAGVYTLVATNEEGSSNVSINVVVQFPAIVTKITSPVTVTLGERAILQCDAEGFPNKTGMIRWERDGVVLKSKEFANRAVLEIAFASANNSGSYSCVVNNGIGKEDRAEALLMVRRSPTIERGPQFGKGAAKIGFPLVLRCRASGVPEVDFIWKRMGGRGPRLENGTGFLITTQQIDHSTFESHLMIDEMKADNFKEIYECVARNALGADKFYVKVQPVDHPDIPSNVRLINVTDTTATIEWNPGFDGGSNQTFQVHYRPVGAGARSYIDVIPSEGRTRFTIPDLRPNHEYAVQVGAKNEIGNSGYQRDALIVRTLASDGSSGTPSIQTIKEEVPVMLILLVCIVGVILLILNICLVCCLMRRHKRKKLQEKTEIARRVEGPRPVQMYGATGDSMYATRPESVDTNRSEMANEAVSEDDQSVRTMIEVNPNGYVEKVNSQPQGYYVEDPNYMVQYDCDPRMYAETLRQNSLQRRIAAGAYAHIPYPVSGYPYEYADGEIADYNWLLQEPPPVGDYDVGQMGPLRSLNEQLDHYQPPPTAYAQIVPHNGVGGSLQRTRFPPPPSSYEMSPSPAVGRRVPTAVVQSSGSTPYAEVRPIMNNNHHHAADSTTPGSPVLSTFAHHNGLPRTKMEYADLEGLRGDLV